MNHFARRRLFGSMLTGADAAIVTVSALAQLQAEVYLPVRVSVEGTWNRSHDVIA